MNDANAKYRKNGGEELDTATKRKEKEAYDNWEKYDNRLRKVLDREEFDNLMKRSKNTLHKNAKDALGGSTICC